MPQTPPDQNNPLLARQEAADADALFAQGRYRESLLKYLGAVKLWPANPDLHFNVAAAAIALDETRLVEPHLLNAISLEPRHARAHDALANWYGRFNDTERAARHSAIAISLEADNPSFLLTRATVLESAGEYAAALEAIGPLLNDPPFAERAAALYARIAPRLGREQHALEIIRSMLQLPAASAEARRRLHFAAATLLDRLQRYDEAFEQARMAHRIWAKRYDPREYERAFNSRIDHATKDRLGSLPHAAPSGTRPVFIVGMPRSGTSLIEQILSCHPQVFAAGELDALTRTAAMLDSGGVPYPQSLERLSAEDANRLANHYLSCVNPPSPAAAYFTDKMPLNFMYLDLVELLLPQSRVIHCTRNPLDTCLSCYMTDFSILQAFAEELPNLAHFYHNYQRIMNHWTGALTVPMLHVRYEDVVGDFEAETARILEFLGLPWDERCLRFHESKRPVATASRDQVRRPLYSSSVGRWKHYEKHLVPLAAMLDSSVPREIHGND